MVLSGFLKSEPPSPEMIQQVGEFAQTYVPTHPISLLELSTPQFKSEFCKNISKPSLTTFNSNVH